MIELNQTEKASLNSAVTLGARKRKAPSHYADHVIELKKVSYPSERKVKNSDLLEEESYHTNRSGPEKVSNLICILPTSNRRLRLNVVIKKHTKGKARSLKIASTPEFIKAEVAEPVKNQNLLESLFKLCQQHKLDEQQRTKQNQPKQYEQINSSESLPQKGQRTRRGRQDQQKYTKMYEKYQNLAQKFEQMECETFII